MCHPSTLFVYGAHWTLSREELDREQISITEKDDCQRSLGLYGDWAYFPAADCFPDWYGGRVLQNARLVPDKRPGKFKVQLEAMEYRRDSTRIARFLGSRRILHLGVADTLLFKDEHGVKQFLNQKFILCGRVFVALKSKEGKVYLVEVREDYERQPQLGDGDNKRKTFQEIIDWHNPMNGNEKQVCFAHGYTLSTGLLIYFQAMQKWAARFDLGLSPSVPVVEFKPQNITLIDDDCKPNINFLDPNFLSTKSADAPSYDPRNGKATAEETLTDGCGYMNRAALGLIARQAHWDDFCCAVQGRIAGAKGVWILHPEHQSSQIEEPKIWIRESQNKVNLDLKSQNTSRAHLIFDLVAPAHLTYPARLNMQTIVNLSHNEVPDKVFENLMEDGIQSDFQRLTAWEGETAMKSLLHAVAQLGGLSGIRLGRELAGLGRALGYGKREWVEQSSEELQGDYDSPQVAGRTKISGEPTALPEKIFEMIAAGFHPLTSRILWEELEQMVKNLISSYILSFHIPTPESLEAFIIPGKCLLLDLPVMPSLCVIDPFGILEPHEIYFHAGRCIKPDPLLDPFPNLLVGPVLVSSCFKPQVSLKH